jgi:hypothetical protein
VACVGFCFAHRCELHALLVCKSAETHSAPRHDTRHDTTNDTRHDTTRETRMVKSDEKGDGDGQVPGDCWLQPLCGGA